MSHYIRKFLLLAAAIGLATITLVNAPVAQAADTAMATPEAETHHGTEDQAQHLDTVVVTAGGYEQRIVDAPASISIVTRKQLQRQPFTNLQDAVGDLPGVSVTGADVNLKDISIRGMPGDYTLILVDGMRQSTRENSHREVVGAAQSAQIPPLQAIERIEVVRGPMSSLYGSDAIGGVINVITRKPGEQWHGALDVHATAQQHSRLGNGRGGDFYLGGPLRHDLIGLQVWGKLNDRSEAKVIDGAYNTRDEGGTARMIVTPDTRQQWLFEAGWHDLTFHSTEGRTHVRPLGAMDLQYQRTHYSLRHTGQWSFGIAGLSVYREVGTTRQRIADAPSTSYPDNRIANTTLEGNVVLPLDRHTVTLGGQYLHSDLDGTNHEGNNTIRGLTNRSWALFAEDTYRPVEDLGLTGGIRFNHDRRYGANWSPRLYAVYQLDPQWSLRGGIGRGFRAPSLRETAPAYVAVTGVGHVGVPRGDLPGNPDLKPETSTNTEIGLQYLGWNGLHTGITVFNNVFDNKIFSQCVDRCSGASGALYAWGNIGKARNRGVEWNLTWPVDARWSVHAGYTYLDSKRLSDDEWAFNGDSLRGQPLARTPKHSGNVRLRWQAGDRMSVWFAVRSASPEYWANFRNGAQWVRKRPGSTSYDLGGTWAIRSAAELRVALLNLNDKRVHVDTRNRLNGLDGNWQVDDGRRLWISLGLHF